MAATVQKWLWFQGWEQGRVIRENNNILELALADSWDWSGTWGTNEENPQDTPGSWSVHSVWPNNLAGLPAAPTTFTGQAVAKSSNTNLYFCQHMNFSL